MDWNAWHFRQAMNFGIEVEFPVPLGYWRWTRMIRSESVNGNGRSNT